jgi:uncharacterized RDD family membrane protein YckC
MKKANWRKVKNQQFKADQPLPFDAHITYAGFWSRILSFVIDIFMIGLPVSLIVMSIFGYDQMQSVSTMDVLQGIKPLDAQGNEIKPNPWIAITQIGLFATVVIALWKFDNGRTPGKRLSQTRVIDSSSLEAPRLWQLVVRFFGYFLTFVSFIFLVGLLLPLLHPKKIMLHDYLSRTVVIYDLD